MKKIQLTQGKVALIDDEDFEFLNQWKWYAAKLGNTFYAGRRLSTVNGKRCMIHMHTSILGKPPKGYEADHEDGNGLNNQRKNLRHVTKRQNAQNRKNVKSSSIYPGVSWFAPYKKWVARIQVNYKQKNLGYFIDELEAFKAYRQAVENLGETII